MPLTLFQEKQIQKTKGPKKLIVPYSNLLISDSPNSVGCTQAFEWPFLSRSWAHTIVLASTLPFPG